MNDQKHFSELAKRMRADFEKTFAAPEGYLIGALERSQATDLDASLLELYTLGVFLDIQSGLSLKTFARLQDLALPFGGFKRTGSPDYYDSQEWIFVDYRMSGALYDFGRRSEADQLMNRVMEMARTHFYLLPELRNSLIIQGPIGNYAGSIPMVGYGAGSYILSALDRAGKKSSLECN